MAAGYTDKNGVYHFGESDAAATASALLNALPDSVSLALSKITTTPGNNTILSSAPAMMGGSYRRETNQLIPSNTQLQDLNLPVEDLDRSPANFGIHQDTTPNRFTVPKSMDGVWATVSATAQFEAATGGYRRIAILRDGDLFAQGMETSPVAGVPVVITATRYERLTEGQVFVVRVAQTSGASINVVPGITRFQVLLTGQSPDLGDGEDDTYAATGAVVINRHTNPLGAGATGFTSSGTVSNISQVDALSLDGFPKALQWTVGAADSAVRSQITTVSGTAYYASVWVKAPVGATYYVRFRQTADNSTIGSSVGSTGNGLWQKMDGALATATTTSIRYEVRHTGGTLGVYQATGFTIVTGAFANPFYGGYPDSPLTGPGFQYDWSGTENASTSTRTEYEKIGEPPPPPPPPPPGPDLTFDAQFATRGIHEYDDGNGNMGEDRIKILADPGGIMPGQVARFNVRKEDIHGDYPRAQLTTSEFMKKNTEWYIGLSIAVPADTLAITDPVDKKGNVLLGKNRMMVHEIFGYPHSKGPNRMSLQKGRLYLTAGNDTGGQPDRGSSSVAPNWGSWTSPLLVPMQWNHFILHYKMSTDPAVGYVALWSKVGGVATGGGYTNQALYQGVTTNGESRRFYKTMGPGNDSSNYTTVKLSYAESGKDIEVAEVFHGRHVVGTTFASVGG